MKDFEHLGRGRDIYVLHELSTHVEQDLASIGRVLSTLESYRSNLSPERGRFLDVDVSWWSGKAL